MGVTEVIVDPFVARRPPGHLNRLAYLWGEEPYLFLPALPCAHKTQEGSPWCDAKPQMTRRAGPSVRQPRAGP